MKLLRAALLCAGCAAFAPVAAPRRAPVARGAEPRDGEIAPKKKGIPLALLIWPLVAVGADIYVSQVQPRLADADIATPALPLVPMKPYGKNL